MCIDDNIFLVELHDDCHEKYNCTTPNALCLDGKCECDSTTVEVNQKCYKSK